MGLRPRVDGHALRFGTLWHSMQEQRWLGQAPTLAPDADPYDAARLRAMLMVYDTCWDDDLQRYEVLAIEKPFRAPLLDGNSKRVRGWCIAGKVDGILREPSTGETAILEHKTTSDSLETGGSYWARLTIDSQISIYFDGAAELGHDVSACLYDVARKPALKPLLATPEGSRKFTKEGVLYATQRATDETPDEYRARCIEAMADHAPEYVNRARIVRLGDELAQARADLTGTVRAIEACGKSDCWPRSDAHCFEYGRCPYWSLCAGQGSQSEFTKVEDVHPELAAHDAQPKE